MKHYVINLDRSVDRLQHIEKQFEKLDLPFTRISGVDGRLLTKEQLDVVIDPVKRWDVTIPASEIGCFLSHRKCLELVVKGEDAYGAIFEDDIAFTHNAGDLLNNISWIPDGADIIKLDTFKTVVLLDEFKKISGSEFKVARLLTKHLCCGGYIVSKAAAGRILTHMQTISVPVDNLFYDPAYELFDTLTIHQVTPAICAQIGLESLIEADRKVERRKVLARPALPARIIREIKRSYRRSSHLLNPARVWTSLSTSKRWMRVSFKK